jgi:ankyrin repeat protein
MMDMLIANQDCDINIPTKTGETPLHYAVLSGSLDAVITLLNAGVDVNAQV